MRDYALTEASPEPVDLPAGTVVIPIQSGSHANWYHKCCLPVSQRLMQCLRHAVQERTTRHEGCPESLPERGGELEEEKSMLRNDINATIGFRKARNLFTTFRHAKESR